ncbi:MAG: Na/Pi cotransporter family protein [Ruminococcaceae bacterium]|nr:Na/Pi cotransporter family protein [Oscillospiraceae bacterium]
MDIFDVLTLIGGLCLFLFGMNTMGEALEKRAGHGLTAILGKLTGSKVAGFLTGLGVTAIIQSSSATTVMVVGFVNSGIMTLKQAINVIMGANVGTTVTAWLLSLTGIESSNTFVQLLKPSSFTPILALIGTVLYMGFKSSKKKDTAAILLGFATLMFGMEAMSDAVAGLKEVEAFRNILVMFSNPILGVLAGAVLTAIIQSSSASVGILQALSSTGQINFGAAIPIIMGQNIGTCVTAMLSSIGTNRNARRASIVHLSFNIIGTVVLLTVFCAAKAMLDISALTDAAATEAGIAVVHSAFNILCTAIMLPASGLLEKLSYKLVPEPKDKAEFENRIELDERLMATPAIALDRCRAVAHDMSAASAESIRRAIAMFDRYDADTAGEIRGLEDLVDKYEDSMGSYLVKLNTYPLSDADSHETTKLLHMIGDLERISDHAVNILQSAEEMYTKELRFSAEAEKEIGMMFAAVCEIIELADRALAENDLEAASQVEPLEQVIDKLKDVLRSQHILRMQKSECTIEAGFVWSDLITDLERVSDHCSNIAACVLEMSSERLDLHDYLRTIRHESSEYDRAFEDYSQKYLAGIVG